MNVRWPIYLAATCLLLAPLARPALAVNRESIQVARQQVAGRQSAIDFLSALPHSHPRAYLWQAMEALGRQQPDSAVAILEQGVAVRPRDAMLLAILGNAYDAQGQHEKAIATWRDVGAWAVIAKSAQSYIRMGEWDTAIEAAQALRLGSPEDAVRIEAVALGGKKQTDAAIALLRASLSEYPTAPQRTDWSLLLANDLASAGRWAEAETVYRQLLTLEDSDKAAPAYIGYGLAAYRGRHATQEAVTSVQRGIALDPQDSRGYVAMGDILADQKKYREADGWYSQAAQRAGDNGWAWVKWGENALRLPDVPKAIRILNETTGRYPRLAHTYYLLALAYRQAGDTALAVEAAEKCVELAPTENSSYWVTAGRTYEWSGQPDKALHAYQQAVAVDRTNQAALDGIARLKGN